MARGGVRWETEGDGETEEDEEEGEDEASRLRCSFSSAQNILLEFLDPQIYFFHKIFSHPLKIHHKLNSMQKISKMPFII